MHWKILASKNVLDNKFFKIQEDRCKKPNGDIVEKYYSIDRPEVAVIAAFTEKMEIIIVEQYRHPVKSIDFELPAGYIEDYEDDILDAAKRELLEETGYSPDSLTKIHDGFASAGLMNNRINFFIGFNAIKTQEQNLDEAEEINVHVIPWAEALNMIEKGKIKDMASVAGMLLAKKYLAKRND